MHASRIAQQHKLYIANHESACCTDYEKHARKRSACVCDLKAVVAQWMNVCGDPEVPSQDPRADFPRTCLPRNMSVVARVAAPIRQTGDLVSL